MPHFPFSFRFAAILWFVFVSMVRIVHRAYITWFFPGVIVLAFTSSKHWWLFFCCKVMDINLSSSNLFHDLFLNFFDIRFLPSSLNFDLMWSDDFHFVFVHFLYFFILRISLSTLGVFVTDVFSTKIVVAVTVIAQASTLLAGIVLVCLRSSIGKVISVIFSTS